MVPTSNAGVSYYRMWSWAVAAHRNRAFHVECLWFDYSQNNTHPWEVDITDPKHYARIMNEMDAKVRLADVVVFQMVHTPAALNLFLTIKEAYPHIPVVAEIDDNMLSTADYNPAAAFYAPGSDFRNLAIQQFSAADAMIVSTQHLKEVYSDFCPNIHVIENSMDLSIWDRTKKKRRPGEIRIGWAGGASHLEDLRIIEPVVRKILEKYRQARFVFVHGMPDFFKGIRGVEHANKWSRIDKYPAFLASRGFDIGVAPLVDNAFNRGKSNLRWLEYGAMRVPCVASQVGHFEETIRDGVDGILCKTEQEWIDAISELIENKETRLNIGNAAYKRIRTDFNTDKNVWRYEQAMRSIYETGQVKKIEVPEYAQPLKSEQAISAPGVIH